MANIIDLKYNYHEYQVILKVENHSSSLEKKLLNNGAKRVGVLFQEEEYWIFQEENVDDPSCIMRIRRDENGMAYISKIMTNQDENNKIFYQITQNKLIDQNELSATLQSFKRVVKFHKERKVFYKNEIQINLEKINVPQLGYYVNFTYSAEADIEEISKIIEILDLDIKTALPFGYYDHVRERISLSSKFYHYIYDLLGNTAFGVSAAVLSILGLMIAVYAALSTKIAIITSIISLALADSLADTYALYSQKKMSGFSTKKALKFGFSNFFSRFFLTSSFILPILFLEKILGIIVNLIIGFSILILLNLLISVFQESSKVATLAKSLSFSLVVLFGSYFAGRIIRLLF